MMTAVANGETPRSLGYSMPAEWVRHRATWLSWPHNLETWPTQLEKVRSVWVQMIQALARNEQVCLLINDEQTQRDVTARLKDARVALENVSILTIGFSMVGEESIRPTKKTTRSRRKSRRCCGFLSSRIQ